MVRPGPAVGGAVPAARHGHRARRRSTSSSSARPAARSSPASSPTRSARAPRCSCSCVPSTIIGGLLLMSGATLHPQRPVARRRGAARGAWTSTGASRTQPDDDPGAPGRQHRLLLRPGAGALRRRLRGAAGRGARAARHQRRGQVDDPARRSPGSARPARGVVRLNGRNITYVAPEQRAKLGIRMLPGGKGVFPAMTVAREPRDGGVRATAATTPTCDAPDRPTCSSSSPSSPSAGRSSASQLSGGQQQMLALAMVLLHDPEVLLIDELSLGLAPVVVQRAARA